MKLLLVFPYFPFPPTDGGHIGFFNPIKYLSRTHEVVVFALAGKDEETDVGELKRYCADVRVFRRPSAMDPYRLMRGAMSFPPGAAAKYWHPAAGGSIRKLVAEQKPDIVEFHHLNTAIYRKFAGNVPTVLREHNVEYKVWERYADNASGWIEKGYVKWTAPRVRKYEAEAASQFDRCVVVSPADADHLRAVSPGSRIEVVPFGVDTEYFCPTPHVPVEPLSITLTSSFAWQPRHTSVLILLTEIFPRVRAQVPNANLYIVGKGMPEHLERIGRQVPGVTIVGPVPDVRPYIARSALLINYLDCGGGIALKVLEAMAMRKPILCNSLACEGIPTTHGKDIFIADGPEAFASAAAYLLRNEAVGTRIAEAAYQMVLRKYSWNHLTSEISNCYAQILDERTAGKALVETRVEGLA